MNKLTARTRAPFNAIRAWVLARWSAPHSSNTLTTIPGSELEHPVSAAAQVALIASIVSEWDQVSRRIFVLRKVYAFDHTEIAARTGISAHGVFEHLVLIAKRLASSPLADLEGIPDT